ncbi:MAG: HAMP domain-containing protein [Alphaproteobacteria bacterium]|nr:HAMP domain-containing protein [Alphaproteobacteria bacterium]
MAGYGAKSPGPEGIGWLPFQFKGLATKIYVAFLLAAAIPTSIAGLVGIFFSLDTLKRETLLNLEQETDGRAEALTRFFDQLSSEIRYLASSLAFQDLALANNPEPKRSREIRARIERDFAAFSHAYPYIYQIRYLDVGGKEVVRVDQRDERIFIVPESELQDKSDRYYVQETLAVAPGDIYVSPLDLNIERGEIEHPEKPVIRFGTPIAAADRKPQGMLIVNLHAGIVLDQVRQMAEARGGNVYLFSRSGFYLSRSAASSAHGSSRMTSVEELTETFPRAFLTHILEGNRGTLELGEWIVAFAPVRTSTLTASPDDPMEWAVVMAFPRRQLLAAVFNLYMLYGVLIVGLVVTAGAGFILSRHLLRPLTLLSQETGEIARGNFASRVEIKGEDEIADLGTRFNQMAEQLERTYASLQAQRDNLEVEVQARTAALDRERRNLSAIIQNTADGILSVSRSGKIEVANVAAERLLGTDGGALAGRTIQDHWPGWTDYLAGPLRAEPHLVTHQVDGRVLGLNIAPILRDGAFQGAILVIRDISEEKRLQDERRELDRQIFQTEKMTSMGELAMGLAHEIGNPLAGMKAVVQALLEEEAENDRVRLYLTRVENEIDRLSGFLRTFHGFAAPREMHPVPCRLEDVLEDVLLWTHKEAKSKGIAIEYKDCGPTVPVLWADPNQLKQVLLNLVINAVHAMEQGGRITVGMCGPFPSPERPEGAPRARFCVEDDGPGIPESVLPRIFDPFFTTRADGTGLGLAVVKKIAVQHGADIVVRNREVGGARFEFDWPIAGSESTVGAGLSVPPCERKALDA